VLFLVGGSIMLAAYGGLFEFGMAGIGEPLSANANSRRVAVTRTKSSKNEVTKLKLNKDCSN